MWSGTRKMDFARSQPHSGTVVAAERRWRPSRQVLAVRRAALWTVTGRFGDPDSRHWKVLGGREPAAPIVFPGQGGRQGCRLIQAQRHYRGRIGGLPSEMSKGTSVQAFESTSHRRPKRSAV